MANGSEVLKKAYGRLLGMIENIPKNDEIEWSVFVEPFHKIISDLEAQGFELVEFRVNDSQSYMAGTGKWMKSDALRAKVEGLIQYFRIAQAKERQDIGFNPPQK